VSQSWDGIGESDPNQNYPIPTIYQRNLAELKYKYQNSITYTGVGRGIEVDFVGLRASKKAKPLSSSLCPEHVLRKLLGRRWIIN
jgi:hypothetical protein